MDAHHGSKYVVAIIVALLGLGVTAARGASYDRKSGVRLLRTSAGSKRPWSVDPNL